MGREIFCLLRRDVVYGFFSLRYRLLIAFLILILLLALHLQFLISHATVRGIDTASITYTDLLFSLFKGIDFEIVENKKLEFPFSWLILQAVFPFLIGGYVREDLYNQSSFLFIRVRHRLSLLISKLLFSFMVVFLLYVCFLIISFLAASIFISSDITSSTFFSFSEGTDVIPPIPIQLIMVPIDTGIMFAFVQSMLTVFIKPVYSFIFLLSLLIVSVFSESALLPGSYSMFLRYHHFDPLRGLTVNQLGVYATTIMIVFGVGGFYFFKKIDIFLRERGAEDV